MAKCPHCGNTSSKSIESNMAPGQRCAPEDLTLLCLAPVPEGEESFDELVLRDFPDQRGVCGMQWCPAEEV